VTDGLSLTVIVNPGTLREVMEEVERSEMTATVGPVTLEEAFLRAVGRSIDED